METILRITVMVKVNCKINGKFCGLCCYNTEMPLSKEDIKRISSLGYHPSEFTIIKKGIPRLRNVNGRCFFLDPGTNMCTIYPYRPTGCRFYPLVYSIETKKVVVDRFCPKWKEVNRESILKESTQLIKFIRTLEKDWNVKIIK